MSEETGKPAWVSCEASGPRDRRNQRRMLGASLVWVLAFLGATLVIKKELLAAGPLLWGVAAIPGVLGVAVVLAYGRFLQETDELERLIQLQALALGFGGGLFAIYAYWMFQRLGAPALDLPGATVIMIGLYMLGVVLGRRRYR